MSDTYISADRRRAQSYTYDACRFKHEALCRAIDGFTRAVRELRDAGLPEEMEIGPALQDVKAMLCDAVRNAAGPIQRAADNEHLAVDLFSIDLSELEAA